MAKPAFIYAFDNMDPDQFTTLCGLLLGSRYKGFLLGGEGPDGGVDAELDSELDLRTKSEIGTWRPESISALVEETVAPTNLVVFQFKHKVSARLGGQTKTRANLLRNFKCVPKTTCELHSSLIQKRNPDVYVLVTNVEVNSNYRQTFIR